MTIRVRLLRLMLVIALVPVLLVTLENHLSILRIQGRIKDIAFQNLRRDARNYLQAMVEGYVHLVERDKDLVEMTVIAQALEVESRLAAPPPKNPRLFFRENYDGKDGLPSDIQLLDKYFRLNANQEKQKIPVSFQEQVYFPVAGVDRKTIERDMALLSTMPKAYARLYQFDAYMKTWLYTGMESGFHTSYPGHGGYPKDYDPRERPWYVRAKEAKEKTKPVWTTLPDVSSRTVAMTCSMSVFRPDGRFAGVTAIDVPLISILDKVQLPVEWKESSKIFHVLLKEPEDNGLNQLLIFNQKSYEKQGQQWRKMPELEHLQSSDEPALAAMIKDISEGKAGVRRMEWKGRDMYWAYSAYGKEIGASVILVPYDQVVEGARRADAEIRDRTREGLAITGIIVLCVVFLVVSATFRRSRMLTQPIRQLASATQSLTSGNFDARVDIHTHDELEELGSVFNDMGPALRERDKMKESLALAMEVQQHLLPETPPQFEHFSIAGSSLYSDETGGDYYDFIDLTELGEGKTAIAVGDITGHGIGAALLMASARAVLRSHVTTHKDLGKLFEDINVHLVRDTGEMRFLTLFYGVLDTNAQTLRWISGGHDPAVWLHGATGEIEELEATGMVLGVMEDIPYEGSGPITLEANDIIAIGTDGIWEAKNTEGEMFTRKRMFGLIRDNADKSADEIHQAIVDAVVAFHEGAGPQEDDITLVVIKTR